jgi:transcriptional regulator with XRE-family HTH domain
MGRQKRPHAGIAGAREAQAIAATLGSGAQATRRRRGLTQRGLGKRVGLGQSEISYIERGHGARTPLETWIAIGIALNRPLAVGFSRDIADPMPRDAGHLAAQELLLGIAIATGRIAQFEVATRPANPSHSIDIGLRDERHRVLIVVEIWNRLDDVGSAARSTARKVAEAAGLAAFHEPTGRVASCWLLVDTAANRALVRRYPAIFQARFDGSSRAWVRALMTGGPPPDRPGIGWVDPRAGRLRPLRYRAGPSAVR